MTSLVVRRRGTEVWDQLSVFDCHNLCHAAAANHIFCRPHGTSWSVLLCVTLPLGRSQLSKRGEKIPKCQEINSVSKCVAIIKTTVCTKTVIIRHWSLTEQSAAHDWRPTYSIFFNPYFAAVLLYFLEGPYMQWCIFYMYVFLSLLLSGTC